MNTISILFTTLITLIFFSCKDQKKEDHGHFHDKDTLKPYTFTAYSEKVGLFIKMKPLVVGQPSKITAHITVLGARFTPLAQGKVTVSLVVGKKGIRNNNQLTSPGIAHLSLNPNHAGVGKLIFDIESDVFTDQIVIEPVTIYLTDKETPPQKPIKEGITFTKEQSWIVDFATKKITRQHFSEIIKTTGQILPTLGDQRIITAKNSGVITFGNKKKMSGSSVHSNELLFTISSSGFIDTNLDSKYLFAKTNIEKSQKEFERAKVLFQDQIISESTFLTRELAFQNAKIQFENIASSYTKGGQKVRSPIKGSIKELLVLEGSYVEIGQPLAVLSQNKKLILKAEVPHKYFSKLNNITSANFKMAYDDVIYNTKKLNGRLISYGKHTSDNTYFVPVHIEIDNKDKIIPGSFVEIFLKTTALENVLKIPYSALMEEQGIYYAYVQISGETFQKRELKIGINDGFNYQILSGIEAQERVVTQGAYQIKLAAMSGKMPAHGHAH